MKKTEGMKPQEPRNPEAMELDRLRIELHNEKIKTVALSRRCIRLGEALDAAISAEDNRVEANLFGIINKNAVHKEAAAIARKRSRAREKNAAVRYEKACKQNAILIGASAAVGFGAVLFGFAGFIHTVLASTIAGASLIAFGWALNTCVNLLGRCE